MKKIVIGAVALLIISQVISTYYLNRRVRLVGCDLINHLCAQRCGDALRDTLSENNDQRLLNFLALQQANFECNIQHERDDAARSQCLQEASTAFDQREAVLSASDAAARETRNQCVAECSHACEATNDLVIAGSTGASVSVVGNVTVDCVEGGAPCFKPVSDFCQSISGACEQCGLSLCGGGEWMVEPVGQQLPLSTTLVAATDPMKNPRVLATSAARGNRAVLNVPPNIKLGGGEQLYFGFSPQKKPGGPFEVRIQRTK